MQSGKRFASGMIGCLIGTGLVMSWPAVGQQQKPAPRLSDKQQVKELKKEVDRLQNLLRTELFQDVDTRHWAYADVALLQAHSVVQNYPPGFFSGKRSLTRYEFAVVISRTQNGPPVVDAHDKATLDGLALEFRSGLEQLKDNAKLQRERRGIGSSRP